MGGCCSKLGTYMIRKEEGSNAKLGQDGATPKLSKIEKKQSFIGESNGGTGNGTKKRHGSGSSSSSSSSGKAIKKHIQHERHRQQMFNWQCFFSISSTRIAKLASS